MTLAVTFRRYREGDEHAINAGFERAFGLHRDLADWQWKFPADPDGRMIIVAIGQGDRLLAHFAGIRECLVVDGREYPVAQNVDVYALPEARRSLAAASVYLETARAFFREYLKPNGLAAVYGFPGPRNEPLLFRHLGWEPFLAVREWERTLERRWPWPTRHDVAVGWDASAIDELWRRAAPRYPVTLCRNASRLARRFAGRPGVEYLPLIASRGGIPHALAVLRADGAGAFLADLLWDGHDPRAIVALDRAAGRLARAAGACRVCAWLANDPPCEAVLRERGWTSHMHPAALKMAGRLEHPDLASAQLVDRLYLTMADADLV